MLNISKTALFLLLGSAVGALGCAADIPPDDRDGLGDDEAEVGDSEDVDEARQPVLAGQTLIQSTHELCWNAYSSTVLNMVKCNDASARQSWIIDDSTWQIRSAYYWGKCAELPSVMTGKVTLKPCNEWQSYQWFPYVPLPDDHGLLCGWVQDGHGKQMCASHTGTSYVYVAPDPTAPDWYRQDF